MRVRQSLITSVYLLLGLNIAAGAQLTIPTVAVGDPNNPSDTRYVDSYHPDGVGKVDFAFRIGQTEITNSQYVTFLNAVAAVDPYDLYHPNMEVAVESGVVRNGSPGNYSYALKAPAQGGAYTFENKPIAFLGSGSAMRFVNWLHNGQPVGTEDASTTEDGAYMLNGATSDVELAAVVRNPNARWWLPSENEWYKAAYFDPATGTYFDYPTASNSVPDNNPPAADSGNSGNSYLNDAYTNGDVNFPLTNVGAYSTSKSPYGTLDQGGNLSEWNETLFGGFARGVRGGSWSDNSYYLHASNWLYSIPSDRVSSIGFRIATSTPEPSSLALFAIGGAAIGCRRRR